MNRESDESSTSTPRERKAPSSSSDNTSARPRRIKTRPGKRPSPISRRAGVIRQVLLGLVIFIGLFCLQTFWLEGTPLADSTRLTTFSWLQAILPDTTDGRLEVVLLDLAKIPGGTLAKPKNRDELQRVIEELRHIPAGAVGIDVDFSPTENGWVVPDKDYDFFNYCLTVSKEMPIFLGVYRGRDNGAAHWLDMPQFSPLAAYIGAAWASDGIRFTRAQEHYIDSNNGQALPSMAYALVQAWYKKHPDKAIPQPGPFLSRITEPLDENTWGRLVNFSKVGQLNREILHGTQPGGMAGEADYYKDKIVILGRTRPVKTKGEPDTFVAPGWGWQPGVLYHASSAWTFGFEPVYEFNRTTLRVLDLMLGAIFLVAIGFRAHYMHKEGESHGFWAHAERYALLIAFALVVLLAFIFMRFFQIMWLDAIWVGIGLLVHYLIPQQIKEFWPRLEAGPGTEETP